MEEILWAVEKNEKITFGDCDAIFWIMFSRGIECVPNGNAKTATCLASMMVEMV